MKPRTHWKNAVELVSDNKNSYRVSDEYQWLQTRSEITISYCTKREKKVTIRYSRQISTNGIKSQKTALKYQLKRAYFQIQLL